MIEKYNFHWQEGFFYDFPKKREIYRDLIREAGTKQIISLVGLRRTGKTTLLKQLIDYLVKEKNVRREHIIFYSFDEEQPKIEEIVRDYEARVGKDILAMKDKVYIFLDEIQKLENWQNQVKYYYDNYKNLKFFVSGSSSLFIRKHVRESLAGRIYEFVLKPLNFREFLIFRNKEELIEKKKLMAEALRKEFAAYQKRQFIEIVNESEERVGQYIKTMIEKVVYQDIPKIFPIDNEELLIRILKIVASNPGMLSDYESLSNELGISRVTLSNYFFYLEESFLLRKIYNFSKNMLTSEKKMKKFYLSSTSFFPYLNNQIEESKLIENLAVTELDAKFFWRTPQKHEVDIIAEMNGKHLPIEVKYSGKIAKKEFKNILRFCEKFGVSEGLMITTDIEKQEEFESKGGRVSIRLVPAYKLLMEKEG